jgi:transposase
VPYLRKKSFKNKDGSKREYLFLVESIRTKEGKIRQKVVGTIGRLDVLKAAGSLERLKSGLEKFISGRAPLKAIKESPTFRWAKHFGAIYFLRKLWETWQYQGLLLKHLGKWEEAVFCMVTNRLLDPASKLGIEEWKEKYHAPAWDKLKAHSFYRAMDELIKKKEEIDTELANQVVTLFSGNVSMVMFDTTSVKHWGEGEYADILEHGYSKEKRGDLPQVIVGVLMTADGIPFAHRVWKGNQSDVKSFAEIIEDAKEKYGLKEVIWVADRGMVSEKNLALLDKLELKYILGVRMRHMEKELKEKLLNENLGFKSVNDKLQVKDVAVNKQRYIVCFNPQEAKHEKAKREYFKQVLQKKVAFDTAKSFLIKNGYKKYLNLKGELTIDWGRFEKEEIYDGKWVLLTNSQLSDKEIGKAYKDLWRIERSFRTLKSPLAVDPMFHWTERRIRAHIFICFIALQIYLLVKKHMQEQKQNQSIGSMLAELDQIHSIEQVLNDQDSVVHLTEVSDRAKEIFKYFKLEKPVALQGISVAAVPEARQPNNKLSCVTIANKCNCNAATT